MKRNQNGFSVVEGLLIIIIVAMLAGVAWYVVSSNKKTDNVLNNTGNGTVSPSKNKNVSSTNKESTSAVGTLSSDEEVIAAVKAWCNANVDLATKKPLVLTAGKAGPNQKQVLYSSDKNFAYVNAVCTEDGTTDGSGAAYYMKKVNNSWVFLYRGQMASPEYTAQFNIPSDFN